MKEFLKKYSLELENKIKNTKEMIEDVDSNIEKDLRMMQYIESKLDDNLKSMQPEGFSDDFNDIKMKSLQEELEKLKNKKNFLCEQLNRYTNKKMELDSLNEQNMSYQEEQTMIYDELLYLQDKVDRCRKVVIIDPSKCKQELLQVSYILQTLIEKLEI